MLVKLIAAAVQGINAEKVSIEINTTPGMKFSMVGLPDLSVKESHERILSALQVNGYDLPPKQTIINLAPADIKKEGAAYDLPLAIGVLASYKLVNAEKAEKYMMMGELGLDGSLRPIKGALPISVFAREQQLDGLIVPEQNAREAAVVNRLKVYGVSNIKEVIDFLNDVGTLKPTLVDTRREFMEAHRHYQYDFATVKGQEHVKRALEIAAAGGHNLIMIGPPGSGKTMMAQCLPSILPPLSIEESFETTKIHSVAGKLEKNTTLITCRPFRHPHHSASATSLIGGGSNPQPGEVSLAHNGVLFADELPEFPSKVLDTLRQPLEDRKITISRIKNTLTYPASFMFIAAINPCPCGYYNDPTHPCQCAPAAVQRYMNRISGPLMDRIDIHIEITPVPFERLANMKAGESSETIRNRVVKARNIQTLRYKDHKGIHCNAQMTPAMIDKYAQPDQKGLEKLEETMTRMGLSARAYSRILKVARTIADLDESEAVTSVHISEAIHYRNLDRNSWGLTLPYRTGKM